VQQARDIGRIEKRALQAARYSSAMPRRYRPAIAPAASVAAHRCISRAARCCHSGAASAGQSAAKRATAAASEGGTAFFGSARASRNHAAAARRNGPGAVPAAADVRIRASSRAVVARLPAVTSSATYTATFHASRASTGGASRLIRCAGPMSTPAAPTTNAPAAASGARKRRGLARRASGRNPG
jgi:hypothetical protein